MLIWGLGELDNLKKRRNQVQKEVAVKKKAGEECDALVKEIKDIGDTIDVKEVEQKELKVIVDKVRTKVFAVPLLLMYPLSCSPRLGTSCTTRFR